MFMESLLDDGLEHCVRDTVLPPPPLLGRSAEPARKRHSRGPRPRPRDDPGHPWIDPNSPRLVPALTTPPPPPTLGPQHACPPTPAQPLDQMTLSQQPTTTTRQPERTLQPV